MELPFAKQVGGRSASKLWKAFGLTLQHSSNGFFMPQGKYSFSGWKISFLPSSIFKQQVRRNLPTKCFLHAFGGFSSSAPCNKCNLGMHLKKKRNNTVKAQDRSPFYSSPASCHKKRKAAQEAEPALTPLHDGSHPSPAPWHTPPDRDLCTIQGWFPKLSDLHKARKKII